MNNIEKGAKNINEMLEGGGANRKKVGFEPRGLMVFKYNPSSFIYHSWINKKTL